MMKFSRSSDGPDLAAFRKGAEEAARAERSIQRQIDEKKEK